MNKNSENLDKKNDELKETSELLSFIKKEKHERLFKNLKI